MGSFLHFFVALSVSVEAAVLAVGVIMAAVLWRDVQRDASLSLAAAAGLCIFALVLPRGLPNYDDGLYYLQTLKWNRDFPVILGLVNLHGRLAFNSILFLLSPLTDRMALGWIPNLLAVAFVMLSLCARVRSIDLTDRRGSVQLWFVTLVVTTFVGGHSTLWGFATQMPLRPC